MLQVTHALRDRVGICTYIPMSSCSMFIVFIFFQEAEKWERDLLRLEVISEEMLRLPLLLCLLECSHSV